MDLVIAKGDLVRLVSRAASAAADKSPLAILNGVLLEASAESLTARGTNLFVAFESKVAAKVKTPGRVAFDARLAPDIFKKLPVGDVSLKVDGTHIVIKAGKQKFKLPTLHADDFPVLPRIEDAKPFLSVAGVELLRCIAQGGYALCQDDKRPELNSMLIDCTGQRARFVSMDGKRMAIANLQIDCQTGRILLPARGIAELRKLSEAAKAEPVEIRTTEAYTFFVSGETVLSIKSVDTALYPPYEKLVQKTHEQSTTMAKDALVEALQSVALVAAKTAGSAVVLSFSKDLLTVSAESSDAGEGEACVDCASDFVLKLACTPQLLEAAVAAVSSDDVRLDMLGELGPITVLNSVDDESLGLVMTLRR